MSERLNFYDFVPNGNCAVCKSCHVSEERLSRVKSCVYGGPFVGYLIVEFSSERVLDTQRGAC